MHCVICNVIPEGQRIFLIRIVPSRLAVILLPEQEGLAVPGDRIRAGLGDGIPVIVGIILCPRDFERERFLHIAGPGRGQLQFLHTNTVVGKGMLLIPSRVLHFKFKGLSGRCFRAGLLDMFHDRNLHFDVCFFIRVCVGTARHLAQLICQCHRNKHSHHCHKTEQTAQELPSAFPFFHVVSSPIL